MSETLPAPTKGGDLPRFTAEDWESHVSTALALKESLENHLWHLAAVCASVSTKYGEQSIPRFAGEIGVSARRVYDYAATYSAWESRTRSQILSFKHHTIAARAEDPQRAIEEAEDGQLSTRELDDRIKGRPSQEMEKCPACNGRGRVLKESV